MSLEESIKRFERAELNEKEKGLIRNPVLLHLLGQPEFAVTFLPENASLYEGFVLRDEKGHRVTQLGLIVLNDKHIDFYTIHKQAKSSGTKNRAKEEVLSAALEFAYSRYGLLPRLYSAKYNEHSKIFTIKGYSLDQQHNIARSEIFWSKKAGHIPKEYYSEQVKQHGIIFGSDFRSGKLIPIEIPHPG